MRGIFAAFIHPRESPTDVGYASQATSDKYNVAGFCFAGVGLNGAATLENFVATGWDYEKDELRILNPATCASAKRLVWLTKEEAEGGEVGTKAGWYDASEYTYEGNLEFDLGSGFLTSLSSKGVSFTYSGEVFNDSLTIPCDGKKYVIIPNALPRTITLSEVIATGWDYEKDELRKLNKTNSASAQRYVWLSKEEAEGGEVGDKAGWYDASEYSYEGAQEVLSGEGFLTSISSKNVMISLPASVPAAE